ncbi:sugar 3,4-ketoisomerase [Nonlabens ulvanivorans]|uniref:sugar 3,4-ketoisomerase n=1 Tax=Nonlabens ulvanivorans TaxID=906888 RepID=UPI0029422CB3|nr:FdtA/QdtA family cupin domain-containing protein [Nonlabens ulvanivorans]WOI22863.1 FdtA/QdtA family cupin domain-containing protein [Nonlabens ulvanivorans]
MHAKIIDVPKITDPRGNLAVIEGDTIPFKMERVYYLYDVPSTSQRGGHAHKELRQLIIALSGSFDVVLDDGKEQKTITLNKPDKGLLIPTMVWRELENFSSGSVCMVVASMEFSEDDYIRDYNEFKDLASS